MWTEAGSRVLPSSGFSRPAFVLRVGSRERVWLSQWRDRAGLTPASSRPKPFEGDATEETTWLVTSGNADKMHL